MNIFKIKLLYPLLLSLFMVISQVTFADPPPPPPPGGGHGATGNQGPLNGGIYDGLYVFVAFAAAYAGYELYKSRKQRLAEAVEE